jgi:S-ribosylhomocysteine lyase LuxS involved in autoinducer biosynthesis
MVGSFKVDHMKLGRGIYLSKAQVVGNAEIITYDIMALAQNGVDEFVKALKE